MYQLSFDISSWIILIYPSLLINNRLFSDEVSDEVLLLIETSSFYMYEFCSFEIWSKSSRSISYFRSITWQFKEDIFWSSISVEIWFSLFLEIKFFMFSFISETNSFPSLIVSLSSSLTNWPSFSTPNKLFYWTSIANSTFEVPFILLFAYSGSFGSKYGAGVTSKSNCYRKFYSLRFFLFLPFLSIVYLFASTNYFYTAWCIS
jgi:hypothetical protein